jgi:hypothetical protein
MFNPFSEMCTQDIILCIATIATHIPLYFMMSSFDDDVTNAITKYRAKIDLLVKENEELKEKLKIYEDEESVWEDIDTDDEEECKLSRTCYECECVVISDKYIHIFDDKRYCSACNPKPVSDDEGTDEGTNEGTNEGTDEGTNKMAVFYKLIQKTINYYVMLFVDIKKVVQFILNNIDRLSEQYIEKHTPNGN